jgi:hypothetical protein
MPASEIEHVRDELGEQPVVLHLENGGLSYRHGAPRRARAREFIYEHKH